MVLMVPTMPKPFDIEAVIAEMRASAKLRAPRMRQPKPRLILPDDWIDGTAGAADETVAIVGPPRPDRP